MPKIKQDSVYIRAAVIAARDKKKWSNSDLARASGVAETVISRWTNPDRADHQPTLRTDTAEKLMAALNLNILQKIPKIPLHSAETRE